MTKEQLTKENYELKALSRRDETLRKRFAKVLNRMESDRWSSYKTPSDLSWEEIFCEIGKLISFHELRAWKDDIEFRINQLMSESKPTE